MQGAPSSSVRTSFGAGRSLEQTVQRRAPGRRPSVRRTCTRDGGSCHTRFFPSVWTTESTPADVHASRRARTQRGASTVGTSSARAVHRAYQPLEPVTVSKASDVVAVVGKLGAG